MGSPSCYFCQNNESIDHLFFMCPVAKVIWGMVGLCIGATNIPNNLSQAKIWFVHWLPGGEQIYTFCMAAICWAIWKKRNEACFDNKQLRNPADIISYACALMTLWAGLYGAEMQGKILDGVKLLLSCASRMMTNQQCLSPPLLLPPKLPRDSDVVEELSDHEA